MIIIGMTLTAVVSGVLLYSILEAIREGWDLLNYDAAQCIYCRRHKE